MVRRFPTACYCVFAGGIGILLAMAAIPATTGVAADFSKLSGTFGGYILDFNCEGRSETSILRDPPWFKGEIKEGRITGVAPRRKKYEWTVKPDGTFGGELDYRKRKGKQYVQRYEGKVETNTKDVRGAAIAQIVLKASFGISEEPDSFCSGKMTIRIGGPVPQPGATGSNK